MAVPEHDAGSVRVPSSLAETRLVGRVPFRDDPRLVSVSVPTERPDVCLHVLPYPRVAEQPPSDEEAVKAECVFHGWGKLRGDVHNRHH